MRTDFRDKEEWEAALLELHPNAEIDDCSDNMVGIEEFHAYLPDREDEEDYIGFWMKVREEAVAGAIGTPEEIEECWMREDNEDDDLDFND